MPRLFNYDSKFWMIKQRTDKFNYIKNKIFEKSFLKFYMAKINK